METTQKVSDWRATADEIWAMLRENAKENAKDFAEIKASQRKTDLQMEKNAIQMEKNTNDIAEIKALQRETAIQMKETDRQMKETDRKIGRLGDSFGYLVEHLIAPNLMEKFNNLGFMFGKMGTNMHFKNYKGVPLAEVDILLEDGDVVMAVEVKAKLRISDIQDHILHMNKLRQYAEERGDKRRLIGAVAGAIIPDGAKPFALKTGFYVIEQSGDTVKIESPDGFVPKEW
jgi:hypothetical protein